MLVLLAALLTAAVVQSSMRQGRLADPPTYDDVFYLRQGAEWLKRFQETGVVGTLGAYATQPPHSVYAVGLAAISFAIFGIQDWAPYVASVVAVLVFLALGDWAFRGVAGWRRYGGAALMALLPMTAIAAHEFRPDAMASAVLSLGLLLVMAGPVTGNARRMALAGAVIGASLLCKPSVFVATGIVTGAAVALASAAEWIASRPRPPLRAFAGPWAVLVGALAAVAALFPPKGWHLEWAYFYQNIVGEQAKYWAGTEDWGTHLAWYLTGVGGRVMLGPHLWIVSGLLAVGAAGTARRGDGRERARAAAMGCLLALLYAMASLNRMKSEFLGLPFQVLLAGTAVAGIGAMLRAGGTQRVVGTAAMVAGLAAGLVLFRLPRPWHGPDDAIAAAKQRLVADVYRELQTLGLARGDLVVMTSIGTLNPDLLRLAALRDGAGLEFWGSQYLSSVEAFEGHLTAAAAVIATEPGLGPPFVLDRYRTAVAFPIADLQEGLMAALRAMPEFEQAARVPVPGTEKHVLLFKRRSPFMGWEVVSGLDAQEGPYPQWKLPVVRWGIGERTRLKVRSDGRPLRLVAVAKSEFDGQRLAIRSAGQTLVEAPVGRAWGRVAARLELPPGEHEVELAYAVHQPEGRRLAVLYRTLVVAPEEGGE